MMQKYVNNKSVEFNYTGAFICIFLVFTIRQSREMPVNGIICTFKGAHWILADKAQNGRRFSGARPACNNACLDTLCNRYLVEKQVVEIIRQDNARNPNYGIALSFEFDENNGDFPYTPAFAVLQLKNFNWGGVEFARNDTLNFTGVSNEVSDDLSIEIDRFSNDTIYGRFSGVLLNGAGSMASLDSGAFRVFLYRQ